MKKAIVFFSLIFSINSLMAQQKMAACCAPSSIQKFTALADDKSFVMSHEAPLPFVYHSANGNDITYKAADGTEAYGWMVKAAKPTNYYLIVVHEYWGLNDYIKQETEKLSNDLGVNAIAIDLYDKQVATTPDEAGKLMQAVKPERAMNIIKGAIAYAGNDAKIFTIGWCFGGGWSLQTAILGGSQTVGCVMYYGMPETDVNKLKTLNCDVISFFGEKDKWINPQVVDGFKANMKTAGKQVTTYEYNADHAFANPSNPHFDKEATTDSYAKTLAFIKERMK